MRISTSGLMIMFIRSLFFVSTLMVLSLTGAVARGVYQEPADFVSESFDGTPPAAKAIFLKGEVKQSVKDILGHRYPRIRVRYWTKDGRSVWILDEIGKERPITTGIVVNRKGTIERIKILEFRESRGWEVRHDFFTSQFHDAGLTEHRDLDTHIDNITGATLSVRAVSKLARMALYLHHAVVGHDA